ncbi:HD family hydrolase [Nitrosopumilus sp.]|uniref:HD family hydrolase n=1 Tax=Nitrosopumilus sp. TaxID=2024843 RepID=UPI0034A01928
MMIFDFLKSAVNLKTVSRQGWVEKLSIDNPESVADHSYSMAVMGMVISDLGNFNTEKILKMILLHDLAETKVGDYTPGKISYEKKKELENIAFSEIVEKLPTNIKLEYLKIWQEYQEKNSSESKMVHQIDKLEMALQARSYQQKGHYKEIESFFESAKKEITDPKLKELFRQILEE